MIEEYEMTFTRNFKYFFFTFLFLATAPLIGFAYLLFFHVQSINGLAKGTLICFAITSMLWLPGLLLHLSYYFNDRKRKIRLTKTGINIVAKNVSDLVEYENISKVEKVVTQSWRLPWDNYGFVKIITNKNLVIKITCLIIDPHSLTLELSRKCKCDFEEAGFALPML